MSAIECERRINAKPEAMASAHSSALVAACEERHTSYGRNAGRYVQNCNVLLRISS